MVADRPDGTAAACPGLAALAPESPLELGLVHRRATLDPDAFGLLVEVLLGRLVVRVAAAAGARGAAAQRRRRAGARLARAGPLAVDGAGGQFLGTVLGGAVRLGGILDVLVLPGALGALLDASGWHAQDLPVNRPDDAPGVGPRSRLPPGTRARRAARHRCPARRARSSPRPPRCPWRSWRCRRSS